jgi:O-antigen/teichoic acid export membrane protein
MWKNYYLYVATLPIFTIVNNLLISKQVDKNYPKYSCRGKVKKEILDKIKRQVAGLMVSKVCTITRNSFDNIFVTAFIGLTASAVYSNYLYIMNAVIMFLSVVSSSIVAGVGNSIVTESVEKNFKDLRKLNFIYMWISGWFTTCLFCLYQPFMKIWVGRDLMASNTTVILFGLYFYVLKMGDIRAVYSEAAGIWWEMRYRAIAEAACNLILNYTLVRIWGLEGIVLATLISLFFINFGFGSQIAFKHYFGNEKIKTFFKDHFVYLLGTILSSVVTYRLVSLVGNNSIVGFMEKLVICAILPNIIYLIIYRRYSQFEPAFFMVQNILRRSKK